MKLMKIAVIDLGTNSVRFDIYELNNDLSVELVFRKKNMVRIGEEVFQTHKLSIEAMNRASEAIKSFSKLILEKKVERVIAFSTCALREAKNAKVFKERVKNETGIDLKIISGKEESRLISKAILSNEFFPKLNGIYALVDIGGGSTEISFCYKQIVLKQESLPLGSSRLSQLFELTPSSSKSRKELKEHVSKVFIKLFPQDLWASVSGLVCSSGTAKAFIKIANAQGLSTDPLKVSDLSEIVNDIKRLSKKEILSYPGMDAKRVDIILAGGLLLKQIAYLTKAKKIYYSEFNLRDGIIEQEMENLLRSKF